MSRVTRWTLLLILGLGSGAAGCGQRTEQTTTSQAEGIRVTDVELGRAVGDDKRITDRTDTFRPNDVIYASVLTTGTAANATLRTRWTYQDGQVVDQSEQAIAPTGDAATEFHVAKPDGWPAGKYKVEVFLNGTPVESADFTVE